MKFKFTKETAKRMLKTFVQTAAGYIIVNIKPYEQIVLDGMGNEFKSKTSHQKLLIYGLICFFFFFLLMINVIIIYSIRQVYLVKDLELDIIKQYFEIFEFLKSYIKMVLVEFIAIFYFIVRWGFNNTLPELFKSLFIRKDIEEK